MSSFYEKTCSIFPPIVVAFRKFSHRWKSAQPITSSAVEPSRQFQLSHSILKSSKVMMNFVSAVTFEGKELEKRKWGGERGSY